MPTYGAPFCLKGCIHFRNYPQFIGDSGKCEKYKLIPKSIFYQAGKCAFFVTASIVPPKVTKKLSSP